MPASPYASWQDRGIATKGSQTLRVGTSLRHQTKFSYRLRDQGRITSEASLDGIYVVRTSVPEDELSAHDAVRSYKNLSVARWERAFRSATRPSIFTSVPSTTRLPERVRAHVEFLLHAEAYYVEWHMRRKLVPFPMRSSTTTIGKQAEALLTLDRGSCQDPPQVRFGARPPRCAPRTTCPSR